MTHEQYKKVADYWKNKEITAMPEEELKSVQVMGKAELTKPFSDKYNEHAEIKKIPIEALKKLESPMNLICVTPVKMDVLFLDFKVNIFGIRTKIIYFYARFFVCLLLKNFCRRLYQLVRMVSCYLCLKE